MSGWLSGRELHDFYSGGRSDSWRSDRFDDTGRYGSDCGRRISLRTSRADRDALDTSSYAQRSSRASTTRRRRDSNDDTYADIDRSFGHSSRTEPERCSGRPSTTIGPAYRSDISIEPRRIYKSPYIATREEATYRSPYGSTYHSNQGETSLTFDLDDNAGIYRDRPTSSSSRSSRDSLDRYLDSLVSQPTRRRSETRSRAFESSRYDNDYGRPVSPDYTGLAARPRGGTSRNRSRSPGPSRSSLRFPQWDL